MDSVHLEYHLVILAQRHVLLLMAVQNLEDLLQHNVSLPLEQGLHPIAQLQQLLSSRHLVKIHHDRLAVYNLMALFVLLYLHRLFLQVDRDLLLIRLVNILGLNTLFHLLFIRLRLSFNLTLFIFYIGAQAFLYLSLRTLFEYSIRHLLFLLF